ncbi:hypothetical protein NSK_004315 [Nannochloropsis salina CCMP1776]|uniref:Uncharacterized protein n=1 Tax=Nannochloropsis salina CCMP1776 TaxID=1027361 RepID=A0A4D9D0C3_9STRA|nr:hypothetical protein NSK_004315 [Nannochloropsis salina CCMP1776]|eukprot:TFJ84324.1 hypothetical protein NSK_004315 [Nannochloropsis salina CCMP1776]
MRWVHSLEGLVHNLKDWTEGKLQDLEVQQQHLGKEEMEQAGESNHLTPEPGLMNHQKENLKLRTIETQIRGATALRQRQRSGAVESIGEAFSRQADDSLRLSPAGVPRGLKFGLPEEFWH